MKEKLVSKKTWTKPELIILLRTHPEESLIGVKCKHPGIFGPGNTSVPPACADSSGVVMCFNSSDKS